MALAIFQEGVYGRFMYEYNHYGKWNEENYVEVYATNPEVENSVVAMLIGRKSFLSVPSAASRSTSAITLTLISV